MTQALSVGRNTQNELHIDDDSVSQRHAQLVQDGEVVTLRDLGSTNGTFVNGQRISSTVLREGDSISFGIIGFRWSEGKLFDRLGQVVIELNKGSPTKTPDTGPRISKPVLLVLGVIGLIIAFSMFFVLRNTSTDDVIPEETKSANDLAKSTVYIEVRDSNKNLCWTGSGAIVGDGSYVLTNAHVAAPSRDDEAKYSDCTNLSVGITESSESKPTLFIDATLLEIDENLDLALLRLEGVQKNLYPSFIVDASELGLDAAIRVIGYPGIGGDTVTLTSGVIAGFDSSSSAQFYKVSAKISQGNSGGPVVDEQGQLIGIATASFSSDVECSEDNECTVTDESIGLVRPIRYADSLLSKIGN